MITFKPGAAVVRHSGDQPMRVVSQTDGLVVCQWVDHDNVLRTVTHPADTLLFIYVPDADLR
jgi:uncharacterized protein YodC (DUF2158 family)